MRMKLTVIDTPGFGDQINNENWYVTVLLRFALLLVILFIPLYEHVHCFLLFLFYTCDIVGSPS